ncbi:heat shock 70 kDa protein [Trifolium repens]|nr:heat shock 70 kDa protein [Trifolium repens]
MVREMGVIKQQANKDIINVSWKAPAYGWHCLNTGGAAKSMTCKTGCGGLVRDYTGRWIYGFTKNLGTASAYMAELWGLHEGLLLARSCGVQQLEIQLDSKVVVCSLKEGKIGSASSCVSSTTTTVYTQPPPEMLQILADDFRGVSLPRLVAM